MSDFKPLLAAPADLDRLDYSDLWVSPKLDGIRAIVRDGVVVSRNLKPIRNSHVQQLFGHPELNNLDGELIVGEPTSKDCYNATNSGVMSADGAPSVRFFAFDHVGVPGAWYVDRLQVVKDCALRLPHIEVVPQTQVRSYNELLQVEQTYLQAGYEGVMLRRFEGPGSRYKFGRSTVKEGTLLKLKRFEDAEAQVIGYEEELENLNEATVNALGHTERSSHAANKRGKGRLGALICRTPEGVEFNIGTGFTAAQREAFWQVRDTLAGQFVKYKSFTIGVVVAPRFPVFLGWRDEIDMGD